MHVVVIGMGEVGRYVVRMLAADGHDLVVIDEAKGAAQYAEENYDVSVLCGYGASEDTLMKAGVKDAGLVVAVTDNDEVNLIAALAARNLGAERVVARAQGNEWAAESEGVRYGLLGVDVVINPRVLVGQEIAKVARSHGASDVIGLADERVELREVDIGDRFSNRSLANLNLGKGVLVAAIAREGEVIIPGGGDVLEPGDRAYLIGEPKALLETEDLFTRKTEATRVCIIGGGVVGKVIATDLLRNGVSVTIIEKDREEAERIAETLGRAKVVVGDGTDAQLLEELELDSSFDLCCAVTSEDEINLMASLVARRVGVGRVATIVQRADYIPIYRQLGLDVVLSPRTVASDHILRYSRTGSLHSLHAVEDGKAEVVELTALAGARAVGQKLKRLSLPRGALIAALVTGDKVVIPHGDDEIHAGDTVILMVTKEARRGVERLFRARGAGV